ncbi:MAG: LicD family protein [Parasporobacterium sp.]|nr:LicD family protein [Parasporobacterium sp.]
MHNVLLEIMDDIHFVCEKYGLQYTLTGGGALGAVRHSGFIPWDNDLDIGMPRKDYNRIRQLMIDEFGSKYYIQNISFCKDYDLNFMKVRLKGSVFLEPLDPEPPEKSGIFVDIFPMEAVRDNVFMRTFQWFLSDGLQFICSCIRIRKKRKILYEMAGDNSYAKRIIILKSLLSLPFSVIPFRKWLIMTESFLSSYQKDSSEYVSIPTGGNHFKGEMYKRNCMFPPVLLPFEDRYYYCPADPDHYLRKMFGDYMTPPPESKREKHAALLFILPKKEQQ